MSYLLEFTNIYDCDDTFRENYSISDFVKLHLIAINISCFMSISSSRSSFTFSSFPAEEYSDFENSNGGIFISAMGQVI